MLLTTPQGLRVVWVGSSRVGRGTLPGTGWGRLWNSRVVTEEKGKVYSPKNLGVDLPYHGYINTVPSPPPHTHTQRPPLLWSHDFREKLCKIVFQIPLTRGHPSNYNKARFSIPQVWPHKKGTIAMQRGLLWMSWMVKTNQKARPPW